MVNVGHFTTEWSICLSVLFCSVKSLLFYLWRYLFNVLQEDFQGWARKTHFFPANYSLRLFRCRNNAKNLMKGLLSSS